MSEAEIPKFWPIFVSIVGSIATLGAIYATFQRLRADFSDHVKKDAEEFHHINTTHNEFRDRLGRIEGVCRGQHGQNNFDNPNGYR